MSWSAKYVPCRVRTGWTDRSYRPANVVAAVVDCYVQVDSSSFISELLAPLKCHSLPPPTSVMSLKIESTLWFLTVWMRIIGFHMGPSRKSGQNRHRYSVCLLITGSLLLLSTVALHCTSFVRSFLKFRANGISTVHNGTNLTTANRLNVGIEHLNYTCVLIGVHTTFFFVSLTSNWSELWDTLFLIEGNLKFNSAFYRKCKKSVWIGFAILFVVNISYFISFDFHYCTQLIYSYRISSANWSYRWVRFTGTWDF